MDTANSQFHVQLFFTERYVHILWNLEVAETHVGRSHSAAWDKCNADLQVWYIATDSSKILQNFKAKYIIMIFYKNTGLLYVSKLQIPVLYGAIVEGVATMLCRLTSKFLSDKEPQYASAIDSFIATSLVVAGNR